MGEPSIESRPQLFTITIHCTAAPFKADLKVVPPAGDTAKGGSAIQDLLSIPYAATFDVAGVPIMITGALHVENPVENSWTEGDITGPGVAHFRVDRHNTYIWVNDGSNTPWKVGLLLDFEHHCFKANVCIRNPFSGDNVYFQSGWQTLASW